MEMSLAPLPMVYIFLSLFVLLEYVVDVFNNRNLFLTAELLKQGYRYYNRHSELIVKYNIGLKTLLQQGISKPKFHGDLVYKFKGITGKSNFSDRFKKIESLIQGLDITWISLDSLHAWF